MPVTVKLNNLRITPRKVRLVADIIRGKRAEEALSMLEFTVRKPALPLKKLLKSAIAAAENNLKLDKADLYISKIIVNEGTKLKRSMPRAKGSASPILKRTSHINLTLSEISRKEGGDVSNKKNKRRQKSLKKNK